MPTKRRGKLAYKILFGFLVTSLAPMGLVGWHLISISQASLRKETLAMQESLAVGFADTVQKYVTTFRNVLTETAGLDDWKFTDGGKFLVTVSGPATNAILECWDTSSWQRKGSVPLHYKTLLDYSVNLEPKSFSLSHNYAVMADGAFRLFDVTRLNEAPKVLQSGFELND